VVLVKGWAYGEGGTALKVDRAQCPKRFLSGRHVPFCKPANSCSLNKVGQRDVR
jgi:hypothetical protein